MSETDRRDQQVRQTLSASSICEQQTLVTELAMAIIDKQRLTRSRVMFLLNGREGHWVQGGWAVDAAVTRGWWMYLFTSRRRTGEFKLIYLTFRHARLRPSCECDTHAISTQHHNARFPSIHLIGVGGDYSIISSTTFAKSVIDITNDMDMLYDKSNTRVT